MTRQEALREAAKRIESGEIKYEWADSSACNCGSIALVVFDIKPVDLEKISVLKTMGVWSVASKIELCKTSGFSPHSVLSYMKSLGFSETDFFSIENLSDNDVRKKAGLALRSEGDINYDRSIKTAVVRYFCAYADLLDEQEAAKQPAPQMKPRRFSPHVRITRRNGFLVARTPRRH